MASPIEVRVPDIGGFKDVNVIDVLVKDGQQIDKETPLVTIETEKAAMDVPAPEAGRIAQVKLNQTGHMEPIPDFLEIVGSEPPEGRMIRIPSKGDADPRLNKDKELNEQLIIEFCSR